MTTIRSAVAAAVNDRESRNYFFAVYFPPFFAVYLLLVPALPMHPVSKLSRLVWKISAAARKPLINDCS